MSTLMDLAAICVVEEQVEAIFYHKRRDWERMHLRWSQDIQEIRRTGCGTTYPEPVSPSIEQIRKDVYRRL